MEIAQLLTSRVDFGVSEWDVDFCIEVRKQFSMLDKAYDATGMKMAMLAAHFMTPVTKKSS